MEELQKFGPRTDGDAEDDGIEEFLGAELSKVRPRLCASVPTCPIVCSHWLLALPTHPNQVNKADAVPLRPGDKVVVVRGDLINLPGKVVSVDATRQRFVMKCTDKSLGLDVDEFEMPLDEVIKFFHVRTSPLLQLYVSPYNH